MKTLRAVCCVALAFTLAPMTVSAQATAGHAQAEVMNANAQLVLAEQRAEETRQRGEISAKNELLIAQARAEKLLSEAVAESANGMAIEQITNALALAARDQGDLNARNELTIALRIAAGLIARADADVANARAQGRETEIANALAKRNNLQGLANAIGSYMAESRMSSAEQRGEMRADLLHTPGILRAENGLAMRAQDETTAAGRISNSLTAAKSSVISAEPRADAIVNKAEASLANANAQAAIFP